MPMTLTSLPTPVSALSQRTLAKGEMLFRQGDKSFAVFAVRRGQVRMVRHLADGGAVPLFVARQCFTPTKSAHSRCSPRTSVACDPQNSRRSNTAITACFSFSVTIGHSTHFSGIAGSPP